MAARIKTEIVRKIILKSILNPFKNNQMNAIK